MRRSKLEIYIDIIKVLALDGPLRITHIMYRVNICSTILTRYLDFLIHHNLVKEQPIDKKGVAYAITDRGMTVLKHFGQLQVLLPITEDAHKIPAL